MFSFRKLFAKPALDIFNHVVDSADESTLTLVRSFRYTIKQLRVLRSATGSVTIKISMDGEPLPELDFTMSNDEEIDINLECPEGSFVSFEVMDRDSSLAASCVRQVPPGFVS